MLSKTVETIIQVCNWITSCIDENIGLQSPDARLPKIFLNLYRKCVSKQDIASWERHLRCLQENFLLTDRNFHHIRATGCDKAYNLNNCIIDFDFDFPSTHGGRIEKSRRM